MANALARCRLHPDSRHSRIGACLGLAISILPVVASAQSCHQNYIVMDQTPASITGLFYEQNGGWSGNLLASVITSGTQQMVDIAGSGASEFKAVLSGGMVVRGQTPNICAKAQIVIYREGESTRMMIK